MNRILFEPEEICGRRVCFGGDRARHVAEILNGTPGMPLKTGVVGGLAGVSKILSVEKAGDGWIVEAEVSHTEETPAPWCDLILAPPRPRALKRLLPQLAALGAGRIVLCGAKKVEKDFWGATLLKDENFRPLLVEGLVQAGVCIPPEIMLRRNFRKFVAEELDSLFPSSARILAHPGGSKTAARPSGRPLVAIGPEGGWTDAEVELLESKGFARFSLGPRILKTETAAIALLAVLSPTDF